MDAVSISDRVIEALIVQGPVAIVLGAAVIKLWATLSAERAFSRDLHERTIKVIEANTAATHLQGRTTERLEAAVDELRRGIETHRQ